MDTWMEGAPCLYDWYEALKDTFLTSEPELTKQVSKPEYIDEIKASSKE